MYDGVDTGYAFIQHLLHKFDPNAHVTFEWSHDCCKARVGAYGGSSGKICYEAIAGLFDRPNSPVAGTGVALDYLRQKCMRISEAKARSIHPVLFDRLNQS
jgi:hypothetical protein